MLLRIQLAARTPTHVEVAITVSCGVSKLYFGEMQKFIITAIMCPMLNIQRGCVILELHAPKLTFERIGLMAG